jgi:hypothetical protein
MRKGHNPAKDNPHLNPYPRHRVIIPVYIPYLRDYFEHSLEVVRLCLASLQATITSQVAITIISNGSASSVTEYLQQEYETGWIDQLLLNRLNRGKIDAVISAARGAFADIITIADCDALFRPGWVQAVEEIIAAFPEVGVVAPFPVPGGLWSNTASTVVSGFVRREITMKPVVSPEDFDLVAQGIGQDPNRKYRKAQAVLTRGDVTACIGAGHFVSSYRKEAIARMPRIPSLKAIEGGSEHLWLDVSPDRAGFWRLSTPKCYVYHMGNVPEQWKLNELLTPRSETTLMNPISSYPRIHWTRYLPYKLRVYISSAMRKLGMYRAS